MKKIVAVLTLIGVFLTGVFLTGCREGGLVDYSEYIFTDVIWTRDNGHDTERLILHADGNFSYSCACGNPVNDSDLCEGYTYNDETKEIKFQCLETTEAMITTVKIVGMSDDVLALDFGGEIRRFEKEAAK